MVTFGAVDRPESRYQTRPGTHSYFTNTIAMENTFDETAVETIDLLEARLRRIEYVVCGHDEKATVTDNTNKGTATQRLSDLEHKLHQLASKSRVVQDLLRLRE